MNPILMTVWALLAASFLALLVYRGQLTRYEDEQLFLNEEVSQQSQEKHLMVVRKLNKLGPVVTALGGAAGLVTASVVGIYVYQAWQQIQ